MNASTTNVPAQPARAYRSPTLVTVAPARELIQGNQTFAPYRDITNDGRTNWPHW